MPEPQRAIVIQSPHSGKSAHLSQALTLLEQAGVKVASVLSIAALNSLPPQGAGWREQGMTLAIAAGGDGVVGGVITHLAGGGLPLGILPLGTSNDIARSLRIPQHLPQAVEVIAQGHTQSIDIGVARPIAQAPQQIQQEPALAPTVPLKQACFAHALTVGLNVQFARIATNVATRQRFGHLAYPVAALQAVRTHEALEVELHFDGLFFPSAHRSIHRPTRTSPAQIDAATALRCRALQVTVVNTPFFGGRWQIPVPAASFSDRLLDIVVIEERGREELNKRLAEFFHPEGHIPARPTRTHASYATRHPAELTGIPSIHHLQARGVTITSGTDPQDATLDGEVRGQTPLQVQVADEPLHVLVPPMPGVLSVG
ncbi:MAG TPA: diacylglycerol kinase family protein [Ktedonobacteraceae bacterium]